MDYKSVDNKESEGHDGCDFKGSLYNLIHHHLEECAKLYNPLYALTIRIKELEKENKALRKELKDVKLENISLKQQEPNINPKDSDQPNGPNQDHSNRKDRHPIPTQRRSPPPSDMHIHHNNLNDDDNLLIIGGFPMSMDNASIHGALREIEQQYEVQFTHLPGIHMGHSWKYACPIPVATKGMMYRLSSQSPVTIRTTHYYLILNVKPYQMTPRNGCGYRMRAMW